MPFSSPARSLNRGPIGSAQPFTFGGVNTCVEGASFGKMIANLNSSVGMPKGRDAEG